MSKSPRRTWLAPEVVQSSTMDCGPASLKSLLEGLGISVSYGRLREACQSDVDGTSIDTIEDLAVQLGLDAEQVMVPRDHVLLPESDVLPALAVIMMPDGLTHFVVMWRIHGPLVQVMDPGRGRTWISKKRLERQLYVHRMPVPAEAWREYAGTDAFTGALHARARRAGLGAIDRLLAEALADESWHGLAALDAALRLVEAAVRSGGLAAPDAARVLEKLAVAAREQGSADTPIPPPLWSVRPAPPAEDGSEQVEMRGAVLMSVKGARKEGANEEQRPLSPELELALREPPPRPARALLGMLREDGVFAPALLLGGLALGTLGVLTEAVVFNGLLDIGQRLGVHTQRLGAWAALMVFALALLFLEIPVARQLLRMGRHLEVRLRRAFLAKIPKLGDRYFRSRLSSDMAERGHSLYALRALPHLGSLLVRDAFALVATTFGIAWLSPRALPYALAGAAISLIVPLASQTVLAARDLRVRTHTGALSRYYYDALLGLVAVRAHNAERALRREHEALLAEWERAGVDLQRAAVGFDALSLLVGFGLSAAVVFTHAAKVEEVGGLLLLVYWALSLPALGQQIGTALRQYPGYRNLALRLFEPLGAAEEPEAASPAAGEALLAKEGGVAIALEGVTVRVGPSALLEGVDVSIAAGEQVAIVGESGAGKSTLVGLLLGWQRCSEGRLLVDGEPLDPARLDALRQVTAWVDPAVHLWNRTLLENLRYGVREESVPVGQLLGAADLRDVVKRLPDGMQTVLGEGGALVSGGEGQRVRFGRALARRPARLVILDEFARGLDRAARRKLVVTAREAWPGATLVCISHDVEETLGFDRVLVVSGGRVVEDGAPRALADQGGRYADLLAADRALRAGGWGEIRWRRVAVGGGKIEEHAP
jgi:ABC-type bacteriocin/lantibiotic exporter with double-glycine peptidase domain